VGKHRVWDAYLPESVSDARAPEEEARDYRR
jgi:hypothetical protein